MGNRSKSSWFDRNLLFIWACLVGAYGISVSWKALKSQSLSIDGGAYIFGAMGLLFAGRAIDGLRERIEELEEKLDEPAKEETSP